MSFVKEVMKKPVTAHAMTGSYSYFSPLRRDTGTPAHVQCYSLTDIDGSPMSP